MVVTPQPEATQAGADILRAGGNALDATVAAALVQGVVDPLMCGLGGFALLQLRTGDGVGVVVDGLSRVPAAADEAMWADRYLGETSDGFGFVVRDFVNEAGAASVMVPGALRALGDAHAAHGRLPWADLVAPAIAVARRGWIVRPHVATVFIQDERRYGRMNYGEKLALTPDGSRLYLRPDGSPKGLGDTVVNADLAATLDVVAQRGADVLATGELATVVADEVARNGGILTTEDLAAFRSVTGEPLRCHYRGWGVAVPAYPGGGPFLAQSLALLERLLDAPPQVSFGGVEHVRILVEVMKAALADKERYGGDPDHPASPGTVPDGPDPELDPSRLDELAMRIRAGDSIRLPRHPIGEPRHTTHVSAIDSDGLAVAMTHTLGNPSGFIPRGTGFMLNGGMSAFDPRPGRPNSIAPGKRRLSTMCPTILLDDRGAVGSLGAPGASWIGPALLQVVSNLLDWGMGIQEAISAPRVAATSESIDVSNRIPRPVQDGLAALGYDVRRSPLSYAFGGVHGITAFGGRLRGGADPQRDGCAAGTS